LSLQTSARNDQYPISEENIKTVALLLPETDIIGNAAYLAGIVPECDELNCETPPTLPESNKYTPIVYILDDITPPRKEATVQSSQIEKHGGHHASAAAYPSPLGIGISGFRNLCTPSLNGNLPCEL
jgi:hypothetical protein